MPAWLIPVIKSVLPYVGMIVSAAAPVFTRKSADAAANLSLLQQQQITELQAAAAANDAHIKELAMQLQNTVDALAQGASLADKRQRLVIALSISAIILSVVSLGAVLYMMKP